MATKEEKLIFARDMCDKIIQMWLLHHSREEAAEIGVSILNDYEKRITPNGAELPQPSSSLNESEEGQSTSMPLYLSTSDFQFQILIKLVAFIQSMRDGHAHRSDDYGSGYVDAMNDVLEAIRSIYETNKTVLGNAELDQGSPNHFDPSKRGFSPK